MSKNREGTGGIISVIKGAIFAVLITLVGILIFALIISISGISGSAVKAVNQFIKILSVFLGCFIFLKEDKGLLKGLFTGLLYEIIISLIFLIVGVKLTLSWCFIDLIFLCVIGVISGIISINVKERKWR